MEPERLCIHGWLTSERKTRTRSGSDHPYTLITTHIDIKSQLERHTISRAELAAIAVAVGQENTEDHLSILTNISLCINTIRKYTINPTSYNHHLHKDLLQLTDQLLRIRDSKQLRTHLGKVKSHMDIEYNELADVTARTVGDEDAVLDISFTEAEPPPPIGGLRTWPHIRKIAPKKSDPIPKITNLNTDIKKAIKTNKDNKTKGVFGRLLQEARDTDIDFSIQACSRAPYRYRRDSYEVAWGYTFTYARGATTLRDQCSV